MPAKTGNVFRDPDNPDRLLNPDNVIPSANMPNMKLGTMFRDEGTAGLSQNHDPAGELALRNARADPIPTPVVPEPIGDPVVTDADRAVAAVMDVDPEDVLDARPKLGPAFDEKTQAQTAAKEIETLRADLLAAKAARKSGGRDGKRADKWLHTVAETEYARPDGGRIQIKRLLSGMKIGRSRKSE